MSRTRKKSKRTCPTASDGTATITPTIPPSPPPIITARKTKTRGFDPRIVDDELRRAEKALLERSRKLESRLGSRPKARLVVGDAAASLLEAAEEDAPERTLLAVGSRDLGVIGRMRLGSVSTKVVHAAEGPVLVHPPLRGER